MDDVPASAPRPRLCHLKKWDDFNGYGFNLHAERGKSGQFVGTIDENSPAQSADLRAGDRIVEVNGTNIGSENHQQVVQRIKAVATETKLLVVDAEADEYYKEHKIVVCGDLPNIDYHETPDVNPYTSQVSLSEINTSMDNVKVSSPPDYDTYKLRLCRLKTWPDFSGYGFNLHADRSIPGQFIGKVDDNSPSEAAGLQPDDRILEVNGHSVLGKSHAEVVALIKSVPGEVTLLVADREVDEHFRNAGVEPHGGLPGIVVITCPSVNPYAAAVSANGNGDYSENKTASVHSASFAVEDDVKPHEDYDESEQQESTADYRPPSPAFVQPPPPDFPPYPELAESGGHNEFEETDAPFQARDEVTEEPEVKPEPVPAAKVESLHSTTSSSSSSASAPAAASGGGKPVVVGGLEFAGSAKEARERMNKKKNVKQDASLSLKDKYDILQKL